MDAHLIQEQGQRGSDDIEAVVERDGIDVRLLGGEGHARSKIDFDAALRLGTWLIAQAIAGGAHP